MIVLINYDFRDGSIVAHVQLRFNKEVSNPLQPLQDQVENEGTLGPFRVTRKLDTNPSMCARHLHCLDTYNFTVSYKKRKKETSQSISCLTSY